MDKDTAMINLHSFRATGIEGLDPIELDSTALLEALRAPFDLRKERLLTALRLFGFLATQGDEQGSPMTMAKQVPVIAEGVHADARTPFVLDAEIILTPAVFDLVGQKPRVLDLTRYRLSMNLKWYEVLAHYWISQFEIGTGRNFAEGGREIAEIQDIDLATRLCHLAVGVLLGTARSTESDTSLGHEEQPLDAHQQAVLEAVAEYQLEKCQQVPPDQITLAFPLEAAEVAEAAVKALIEKDYIHRVGNAFSLTPSGLLRHAQAPNVAAFAKNLLDYLKHRASQERARFTHFTWRELEAANVAGEDEQAFASAVIAILRITKQALVQQDDSEGPVWLCPKDIAALRGVSDVHGLRDRAERIRKEEVAAAEAAREKAASNEAAVENARWDETFHRLQEWTNGPAHSERLAAQLLLHEGYRNLDPSHPLGGPDGGQDARCSKDEEDWIMAVYFPRGKVKFSAIKQKFQHDLQGVANNGAEGIVFVTNQELTLEERKTLRRHAAPTPVDLVHIERIIAILDKPDMASVRRQFLSIQ